MSVAFKLTHVAEGLDDLIGQFKGKPNFEAWISSFLEEIQELENAAAQVSLLKSIADSSNIQLDDIGDTVGQPRGTLDDVNYRAAIRARVLINKSGGTGDDILGVLIAFLAAQTGIDFEFIPLYPAGFKIVFSGVLGTISEEVIAAAVKDARLGGVAAHVEYSAQLDANTFTFASGDTAEASATQGFGNDAGTTGGAFSDVIEA